MVDLGQGFAKKYPKNGGTFILQCCELALKHFPTCINARLLKAETLFAQHKKLVQSKGKDDFENKAKFAEMNKIYKQIQQSGYRQMSKQMYINWLLDLKENKDKYINKKNSIFKKIVSLLFEKESDKEKPTTNIMFAKRLVDVLNPNFWKVV